ncbi:hypothetical protein VTN00DRAFT_9000 [Thermoascus crustaceus]|uniref:uncharacterized protein n=1 Tax=Thermoascus crustaceus TaxID=5088 RepID=UPI0037432CAF
MAAPSVKSAASKYTPALLDIPHTARTRTIADKTHDQCDERPPQCSNCARRQIECDFAHRAPSTGSPALSSSTDHPSNSPLVGTLPGSSVITTASGLNVSDLELLHHYTTATYKTLPSGAPSDQHELWQIQVVQLGFQHEFLLRGILAVSALHLLCLYPNRQHSLALRASAHQSIALAAFQEALNRVDTSNCIAIFAFSCIIVVLAFATPRSPESAGFQKNVFATVSRSFLAPLLKRGMIHETVASHTIRDSHRVTDLLRLCSTERLAQDREAANAYALAIHELLNTYTQVSILTERKQDFVPVIFVWPIAIPQPYLVLLRDRQPEAMVILAYYSALLQRVDDQWFMRGWARYLVSQIDAAVGEEWQAWLAWPKEVTGVVPSSTPGEAARS